MFSILIFNTYRLFITYVSGKKISFYPSRIESGFFQTPDDNKIFKVFVL